MSYLFDTAQGKFPLNKTNWEDWSGNGYALTASASAPTLTTGFRGLLNGAANFVKASSQILSIADASCANLKITGSITITCWVKANNVNSVLYQIVSKSGGSGSYGYTLYLNSTNKFSALLSNNGTATNVCSGGTTPSAGTLYFVAMVYNGTDIRLYVNGTLDTSGTNPLTYSSGIYNNTAAFTIGASSVPSNFWDGVIDEVCVWNSALTATDIANLYNYYEEFLPAGSLSGTLKDKQGNIINASTYNVRANAYPMINTKVAPVQTSLITAAGGTWSMSNLPQWRKHLVSFEYEGSYAPTSETDIAGSEYLIAI